MNPFEKRKMMSGDGAYDLGHIPPGVSGGLVEPSRCAAHVGVDILECTAHHSEVVRKSRTKIKFGNLVSGHFVNLKVPPNSLAL